MRILKRILLFLLIAVVLVAIGAAAWATFFLDSTIKSGVETFGPKLTGADVKLNGVRLMLFSGSGKLSGLVLGNPKGYQTASAISVGEASLSLQPASLLKDKVVITTFNLQSPEITYETDLRKSNLKAILENIEEATGGGKDSSAPSKDSKESKESKESKKLQVDEFLIKGGKIHVSATQLGGRSVTLPLPEIHLTQLGTGPDGITAGELTKKVLTEIEVRAATAAKDVIEDVGKGAIILTKQASTNVLDKAAKGIQGLLPGKK